MAEEENKVLEKGGAGKGLMMVLIALVVVLILAVGGMAYFLFSSGALNGQANSTVGQEEASDVKNAGDTYRTAINDLVLNITNSKGREKLMKLSFSISSIEPKIASIVEEYKAEIIDVVISQISARSSEELLTIGGKALLKEELIDEINSIINEMTASNDKLKKNSVKQLYFTAFVIK